MSKGSDHTKQQIAAQYRERQRTKAAIDRMVSSLATLRTTYANQGAALDGLLDTLSQQGLTEVLDELAATPDPCTCTYAPIEQCPLHGHTSTHA